MKPALAVFLVEPLGDDAVDDLVGNQVAAVHDLLGREAHRGLAGDGRAQDVAGRELRNAEASIEDLGLRALAAPGGPRRISLITLTPPQA